VLVLLAVLLAAVPGVASAAPTGWWMKCVMPGNDTFAFTNPPKASADLVAAIAQAGSVQQIWVWRPGDSAARVLVTAGGITANDFAVADSRLAWIQFDHGAQVMTWKIGDPTPTAITTGTGEPADLSVSGDRVVWLDTAVGRIRTWKMGEPGVTTLGTAPYGNMPHNPSVSGDRIVYQQSNGSVYQIISWKAGDEDPVALDPDGVTQIEPVVSGDRVAWVRYLGEYDAFVRTKVIGGSETVTVGPVAWAPYVFISGDRLAWRQWAGDPAGGSDLTRLVTWKSSDATPTRVTHEGEYVYGTQHPTPVSGDRLAWLNRRGVQSVQTWAAGDATPTVLATGMALAYPAIGGDAVAWLNATVGATGIYVAHPQALPKLTTPYSSPTKPTHARYFSIKGGIGSADSGSAKVSLRIERYYSRRWHYVTTYSATLSAGARTYSYTRAKVSKAGTYRVRASHTADFAHRSGTSSWKTVYVK
jgi:hypothetical protein